MINWCNKNIGKNYSNEWVWNIPDDEFWATTGHVWAIQGSFGNTAFYFRNEADATLFSLRWACQPN